METFFIPTENDFRNWIKEAVKDCFTEILNQTDTQSNGKDEPLLNRKEIAKALGISLVTLTDWKKRGLPSLKQRGP